MFKCGRLKVNELVCRLPISVYRVFVSRVFGRRALSSVSRRALVAVHAFFRGGLGLSRASERLCMREGALICHFRGLREGFKLSVHTFRSTLAFGLTVVIISCVGCSGGRPS